MNKGRALCSCLWYLFFSFSSYLLLPCQLSFPPLHSSLPTGRRHAPVWHHGKTCGHGTVLSRPAGCHEEIMDRPGSSTLLQTLQRIPTQRLCEIVSLASTSLPLSPFKYRNPRCMCQAEGLIILLFSSSIAAHYHCSVIAEG